MIHVALVEDDKSYRAQFTVYLNQYGSENGEKFKISTFTDGDEITDNYKGSYDIILMDIEMTFMDGMTAAEKIREVDSEVVIIFITNMPQYVMKGYKVDALDYVLKPVNYFAFSQRIDRALTRMKKRSAKYLSISIKGGLQKLEVSQIYYVEVVDHDLIFHTKQGMVITRSTMKEVEKLLEKEHFFRCNKCYLINLEHVDSIQNNEVIVQGEAVQVSRARRKALLDTLNNYVNEVMK